MAENDVYNPPPRDATAHWFALTVKPQHETAAFRALESKSLEAFHPFYMANRNWSDRTKRIEAPLFPGYVFCRFRFDRRLPVLTTAAVTSIVGFGKAPCPVGDEEIASIRAMVDSGCLLEPWMGLKVGQRVRVERGVLAGVEGILTNVKGSYRVVVTVELLQRSVAVEIDRAWITPVGCFAGQTPGCRESVFSFHDCH